MGDLYSWGRYPAVPQTPVAVHWRTGISQTIRQLASDSGDLLPYGNGRSYGDSCLASSGRVLHARSLSRFISVDWQTGVLVAEAGVTLQEVLQLSIPRGWFLSVTPGTKFVTLGGALANDVHGKNHFRRGTFGRHVKSFGLVRSDSASLICSPQENSALFAATIGGLGLTGFIEWVELQLMPIQSGIMNTTEIRFNSLSDFFVLSAELDQGHEYSVAWIDCLAKGRSLGRGIYSVADHAQEGELAYQVRAALNVPFTPPVSMVNQVSLKIFNALYYHKRKEGREERKTGYDAYFYPLDAVLNWNRMYGPKGFQQYQCVIPDADAADTVAAILKTIADAHEGSFLAVLKRFGDTVSPGLLSFPMPGTTLALDFPERGARTEKLFARLDTIVRGARGRLYPAKDAHMSGKDFRAAYPQWEKLEEIRDPLLQSRFWKRVTTT